MNHTLLLASLERLHDRITALEKGVDGVHLGARNENPPHSHHIPINHHNHMHHNPTKTSHAETRGYGGRNPPSDARHHAVVVGAVSHAQSHAIVVDTVAEEIVNIAESWVGDVEPHELLHTPTESQRKALVDYIKRYNSAFQKSELSAAVTRHLSHSVLTRNSYVGHLVSAIRVSVDQAYQNR